MLFVQLFLALCCCSLGTTAAIPFQSLDLERIDSKLPREWSSSGDASWGPSAQPETSDEDGGRLTKRTPYYFPETVPDSEEIASHLGAMREAGLVASSQEPESKSINPSGTEIDPRVQMRPMRDLISELDQLDATQSVWDTLPPFGFFVVATALIAVLTVFRGCLRARH
ncbi:hypothetical protein N7462_003579 [Penicillium macrosclerotiorum]|uniref:uncharacterized protein n=1 Tax=Penicillium macrosclerotiorum TaxID=303699 RepID=UPI002547D056|nr:uncharacterized protein N7462_003579 [Penicillium macrosclerotiorum]KAJ5689187.1 hypothetical protein N7462_003579 [Penicillium macrosclerotiorum]